MRNLLLTISIILLSACSKAPSVNAIATDVMNLYELDKSSPKVSILSNDCYFEIRYNDQLPNIDYKDEHWAKAETDKITSIVSSYFGKYDRTENDETGTTYVWDRDTIGVCVTIYNSGNKMDDNVSFLVTEMNTAKRK